MTFKEIIDKEIKEIRNIPSDNPFDQVVDLILKSNTCILSGVGKAGDIANQIASQFNSISIRSTFLNPLNSSHGDIGFLRETDLLFVISNSAKTREILELINLANKITKNKIKVVLLTGNKDGELNNLANYVLHTGDNEEMISNKKHPLGLVPTISKTKMGVIGDILTVKLINKSNFNIDKYKYNHHSGYISELIKG